MSDRNCRIASVHVHPIKSCGGVEVRDALLIETGLEFDRAWMVVSPEGDMLTQRDMPELALVQPQFRHSELVLRAPGMLALHLRLEVVEKPTHARVWNDVVKAYDMGDLAAQWFSDFLKRPARLVRFDPEEKRLADMKWTGGRAVETAFADGFPLLVAGAESLGELNRRLREQGHAAVTMQRFRPNLVLEGLEAFEEDHIDELLITTPDGPVRLKLVKPCVRCGIPNVDPVSAEVTPSVGLTLASFRSDPRMEGAITFGMNAIVLEGVERLLAPGQAASASLNV